MNPDQLFSHRVTVGQPRRRGVAALLATGLVVVSTGAHAADGAYDRIIVFGDSISDSGTYAAKAPAGTGRFTTNPDPVWVEVVAGELGLDLQPHVGAGGTNYAEGGARVAATRDGAPGDLSRRPVVAQVDDFLAGDGRLGPSSLVIIQGGGNDVFATQTNGLSFTPQDLAVLDGAATALAAQVDRLIDAGAGTVVTTSVPKFEPFNQRYEAALAATGANVLYFDKAGLIAEIEANPAAYGIVNTTDRACRGRSLESFVCGPDDYVTPDANRTYLYADAVHFTGVVHEMEGKALAATLNAIGQVSALPYVAQSAMNADHLWLKTELAGRRRDAGRWSIIGNLGYDRADIGGAASGIDADSLAASLGATYAATDRLDIGALLSWRETDGEFGAGSGGFDGRLLSVTGFGRASFGPGFAVLSVAYGDIGFTDITRRIELGTSVRREIGDSDGRAVTAEAELGWGIDHAGLRLTPIASLRYEHIRLDGYAEAGSRSTAISFGDQRLETLVGSFGIDVAGAAPDARLRPFGQLRYVRDLLDQDRQLTLTPSGAPVAFTAAAYEADPSYGAYAAGLAFDLPRELAAHVAVGGTVGRSGFDAVSVNLGLRTAF